MDSRGWNISAFGMMSHFNTGDGRPKFRKGLSTNQGVVSVLDRECARQLFHGYRYVNKESDMGLAALADSKRFLPPRRKKKIILSDAADIRNAIQWTSTIPNVPYGGAGQTFSPQKCHDRRFVESQKGIDFHLLPQC